MGSRARSLDNDDGLVVAVVAKTTMITETSSVIHHRRVKSEGDV
jgi:hypothetical protein